MLLFIGYKIGNYCFFRLFQYISCYSLSQFLHTFEQINWKFQYISCYSLSWILSYEGRKVLGFNTSHVTLYRLDENESYWSLVFQYISCYSLSVVEIQKLFKLKGFQYISCYSLSEDVRERDWWNLVSIHLMLLFIAMDKYGISLTDSFQYISCYSLSLAEWIDYVNAIKFQYISCYSLSLFKVGQIVKCRLFQYISCYSLSCLSDIDFYRAILFQYISCYSLSNLCYKSGPFLHVSIHLMLLFICFCSL